MNEFFFIRANNQGIIKEKRTINEEIIYKEKINIIAGESMIIHDKMNIVVQTLLGSCISMCFYDMNTGYAGINHFVMPTGNNFKSGIHSVEFILEEMIKLGSDIEDIECKIYGGSYVNNLKLFNSSIGEKNAAFAFDYCKTKKIKIKQHIVNKKKGLIISLSPFFITIYREIE